MEHLKFSYPQIREYVDRQHVLKPLDQIGVEVGGMLAQAGATQTEIASGRIYAMERHKRNRQASHVFFRRA